ncbi:NAD(P)-dependent glycerol-3-phosphate dehydrogenase [candidate division WOR-3 bacterium]|nr:NAD(P)-dependent glycerol-3-phosphate dehydrogenase [candidate division WOR-3 bacterium]
MKVSILGAGNWGTTLCIMLSKKAEVSLWAIEKIEGRENKKYLPGYLIPSQVTITANLKRVVKGANLLIFALPSRAMRDVASQVRPERDTILLSTTKGIENQTLMRMSEILKEEIGVKETQICVLSGPTIAREVIREIPTTCVCASKSEENSKFVQKLFNSPVFRVYTSTDTIGAELGGALKNVIAITSGICDGLGLGTNAKGAILTRGLHEITRLGTRLGAKRETFAGLSGMGDLITTSFSKDSRNRWLGEQIGKGKKLKEILSQMVEVAEGMPTTESAFELSNKYNISMPITCEVYNVLFKNKSPRIAIHSLMTREPKPEKI